MTMVEFSGAAQLIDSLSDDAQGVDIQTTIRLVEDSELGLEHSHLEDLIALLLTTGEAFVDRAAGELVVQLDEFALLLHQLEELSSGQRIKTSGLATLIEGSTHKVHHADARDLDRILEAEEETAVCALLGLKLEDILTLEVTEPSVTS